MTTTTDERRSAVSLRPEFARMRKAGASYREIGEVHGFTHEMVRKVLSDDPSYSDTWERAQFDRRKAEADAVTAWLIEHGPVMRSRVRSEFGLTQSQLSTMISEFDLPAYLIMTDSKVRERDYTDEGIEETLRRVWEQYQTTHPDAEGLAHVAYDGARSQDDPSAALLISRYGWEAICKRAGVPAGPTSRPKDSYGSEWEDEQILDAVAAYVAESIAAKQRPSYVGYDTWQKSHDFAPSGSHVRNRMRMKGAPTWPVIVATALGR